MKSSRIWSKISFNLMAKAHPGDNPGRKEAEPQGWQRDPNEARSSVELL